VATVVTDVATFSDFPSDVVRKVHWETEGQEGLLLAMRSLVMDREDRETLGRAALDYVEEHHEWSRVARLYVDEIERCHEELGSGLNRTEQLREHRGPTPTRSHLAV
jgi:hypothetical protein